MLKCVLPICIFFLVLATGCTKNNYIDTGVSNGRHDCSLLEYMERHSYDWDSTVIMVRHAGLESLFENNELDGKHYDGITFLGITNHSIRRYLLQNGLKRVTDLNAETCRKVLLRCILEGKYYRKDFVPGEESSGLSVVGEGGAYYTTLGGSRLWIYSFADHYQGIPKMGPVTIFGVILDSSRTFEVASADIEPNNCVVHALEYAVTVSDFLKSEESLK